MEDKPGAGPPGEGGAPLIVAWDTCTIRGVLAVSEGVRLRAETYFEASKGHTGWLMPQLDMVLKDLRLAARDIDYVACGLGPGTFTGVKVGVACGKAVALGLGVPLIGIPTLDLLARGAPSSAAAVLAVMDARRGQFYAAAYRRAGERLERVTEYLCARPQRIAREAASLRTGEITVAGEAPEVLVRDLERLGRVSPPDDGYPRGDTLAEMAWEMVGTGEESNAAAVTPIYLKKPT